MKDLFVDHNNHSKTGGGAATSAGIVFQANVGVYLATLILANSDVSDLFGLGPNAQLTAMRAETGEPIDDVLGYTSYGGVVFVQAKTQLSLSNAESSEFSKVIKQFVCQMRKGITPLLGAKRSATLNLDRFVLVVGHGAPSTVHTTLSRALLKCREQPIDRCLSEIIADFSNDEASALSRFRNQVKRHWHDVFERMPLDKEELELIRLIRIIQLDFRDEGDTTQSIKNNLRETVLRQDARGRSEDLKTALFEMCSGFATLGTGGDLSTIRSELIRRGLPIDSPPDFRGDIEKLREHTITRIGSLQHLSMLADGGKASDKIEREVVRDLKEFIENEHVAVIGEPGVGKSGCLHDLAYELHEQKHDVVLLVMDMLDSKSVSSMSNELGLQNGHSLAKVLENWSGNATGYLIVDALDAARAGTDLRVMMSEFRSISERAKRWCIIASIREYDLRANPDVAKFFKGQPHDKNQDERFMNVRHISVGELSDADLQHVAEDRPGLQTLIDSGPDVKQLVRNLFNLKLLCELLDHGFGDDNLKCVRTQIELLKEYWRHRVENQNPEARRSILRVCVNEMVSTRSMSMDRDTLAETAAANIANLEALYSDGVLRTVDQGTQPSSVIFSHNILYDYAVSKLWVRGLEPKVIQALCETKNQDLLLAIRPSISMAFREIWSEDDTRDIFWMRALAMASGGMRLIGQIIATDVASELYRNPEDLSPLLDGLKEIETPSSKMLRHTIQAALSREGETGGLLMIGENAPSWMQLAEKLTDHIKVASWDIRSLMTPFIRDGNATEEQRRSLNIAAVALLEYALDDSGRFGLVRPALEVASKTISARPENTRSAIDKILEDKLVELGGHEWLGSVTRHIVQIARVIPDFAIKIVDVVFRQSGDRDAPVPMGTGRILSLTTNTHDMFSMAKRSVSEAFKVVWEHDPVTATRILIRVVEIVIELEHPHTNPEDRTREFIFRGKNATAIPDGSVIWSTGDYNRHEDWHKILEKFKTGIRTLASDPDQHHLLDDVLDVLRDEAKHAIVWNAILEAGADEPDTFGSFVHELLASSFLISHTDTRYQAGRLIESSYAMLDPQTQDAVEGTIVALYENRNNDDPEYVQHRADRVLCCIPGHLIRSSLLKDRHAVLVAEGDLQANTPDYSMTVSWGKPDDDGANRHWWLRDQGAAVDDPQNIEILELIDQVRLLPGKDSTGPIELSEAELFYDQLVHAQAIAESCTDPVLQSNLQDEINRVCSDLAARDGLSKDMQLLQIIRETLLRNASHKEPEYQGIEDDERWNKKQVGWSSNLPRVCAAEGLIRLASAEQTVDDDIRNELKRLARDPAHQVRYQILSHFNLLWDSDRDLMWAIMEQGCREEQTLGVFNQFCSTLLHVQLFFKNEEKVRLRSLIDELYQRVLDTASLHETRSKFARFYIKYALWQNDQDADSRVNSFITHFYENSNEVHALVSGLRDLIRYDTNEDDIQNLRVRTWAIDHLTRVTNAVADQSAKLRAKYNGVTYGKWKEEDIDSLRKLHQLGHNVATEVYFGIGAYDEKRGNDENSSPSHEEKKQTLVECKSLFDALCNIEFVEAAYDILQIFEFLIDADDREIILRIQRLIDTAQNDNLHLESMAAGLVVRILERYLSDHSSLFRDPNQAEARDALMDILDIFIQAGWPSATRLTYRLNEVFR